MNEQKNGPGAIMALINALKNKKVKSNRLRNYWVSLYVNTRANYTIQESEIKSWQ